MDRSACAACAAVISLVVVAGCGERPETPPSDSAPLVLAELQAASPGPWRRDAGAGISPTSLERANGLRYLPPPSNSADAPDVETPWAGQASPYPLSIDVGPHRDDLEVTRQRELGKSNLRFADPDALDPGAGPDDASEEARGGLRSLPIEPAHPHKLENASRPRPDETGRVPRKLDNVATIDPEPIAPDAPSIASQSAERVTLPWANAPQNNAEMAAVLRQADEHVRHGISLTERNAMYLARGEFLAALQLIAQANDVQQNVQFYTDALTAGLAALDESDDFVRQRRIGRKLDVERVVAGHKTPVLKDADLERLSPTVAAQRYYTYAQEQLAAAAARQPCGSRALFGLGKLALAAARNNPAEQLRGRAEAMVYYQAALLTDANNGRAANELGVIMATNGDLDRARELLVHSVRLSPHPSTHRNLAVVYTKLGQTVLAEEAKNRAIAMERAGYRRGGPAVEWLDPATFAARAPATDSLLPPVSQPAAATAETKPQGESVSTARKGLTDWLPWNPRR